MTVSSNLRVRAITFAVQMIRFCMLPPSDEARVLKRQLLRSATSPGASFREATRARSNAEMIGKLETALQELDESLCWMELLVETDRPIRIACSHSGTRRTS